MMKVLKSAFGRNPSIKWPTLNFPLAHKWLRSQMEFLVRIRISQSFDKTLSLPPRSIFLNIWNNFSLIFDRNDWCNFHRGDGYTPIKLWLAETIAESVCFQLTRVHFERFLPSSNERAYKLIHLWFGCTKLYLKFHKSMIYLYK